MGIQGTNGVNGFNSSISVPIEVGPTLIKDKERGTILSLFQSLTLPLNSPLGYSGFLGSLNNYWLPNMLSWCNIDVRRFQSDPSYNLYYLSKPYDAEVGVMLNGLHNQLRSLRESPIYVSIRDAKTREDLLKLYDVLLVEIKKIEEGVLDGLDKMVSILNIPKTKDPAVDIIEHPGFEVFLKKFKEDIESSSKKFEEVRARFNPPSEPLAPVFKLVQTIENEINFDEKHLPDLDKVKNHEKAQKKLLQIISEINTLKLSKKKLDKLISKAGPNLQILLEEKRRANDELDKLHKIRLELKAIDKSLKPNKGLKNLGRNIHRV
ncbi:MAG: hypothetical protein H0W88_11180 [Parachlamydiaceae bacterium]|nr:hypothetical protein [Parachlamydiaceae bacterium]